MLADVAGSAAAALGVRRMRDTIGFGEVQHAVIVLVDGLGWNLLTAHADDAPVLAKAPGQAMSTVFPSTTGTALASLGTGLLPGAHGIVGGSFWLPEVEQVLNPLQWPVQASPVAVQPEPTVFEIAADAGIDVTTIADPKFADSGLTRAALRGGRYLGVDLATDAGRHLHEVCHARSRTLTYVYWGALDRVGHVEGAGSKAWCRALRTVDAVVASLAQSLPAHSAMLVTADHGMVNCPPEARIRIDDDPELMAGIRLVAGEPRVRQVYTSEPDRVAQRWAQRLVGRARVFTRNELIDTGVLGPVDDDLAERVGDVVAVAQGDTSLTSRRDDRVSGLLGQHGAQSAAEMQIPALWIRA